MLRPVKKGIKYYFSVIGKFLQPTLDWSLYFLV